MTTSKNELFSGMVSTIFYCVKLYFGINLHWNDRNCVTCTEYTRVGRISTVMFDCFDDWRNWKWGETNKYKQIKVCGECTHVVKWRWHFILQVICSRGQFYVDFWYACKREMAQNKNFNHNANLWSHIIPIASYKIKTNNIKIYQIIFTSFAIVLW